MSYGSDEHYCPNCNASLDDQSGFDPKNCDGWVCQSCGQFLYADDVYEGYMFPGTMWYCDSCGALLNKQDGFNDYSGTWVCSECYHTNNISEDEIIDVEEHVRRQSQFNYCNASNEEEKEYYCPNCNAILNDQYGFDPENCDTWICTECGQYMHSEGIYEGEMYPDTMWYCDSCGELLNAQYGFSDRFGTWECTNCHHVNKISDSEIVDTNEHLRRLRNISNGDRSNTVSRSNSGEKEKSGKTNSYYTGTINRGNRDIVSLNRRQPGEEKQDTPQSKWPVLLVALAFGVLFIMAFYNDIPLFHPGRIKTSLSEDKFRNKQYYEAIESLNHEGFSNIQLISADPTGLFPSEGWVDKVTIDGKPMKYGDWYKSDTQIIINYKRFSRQDRNGFNDKTNNNIQFGDLVLSIPSYFTADASTEDCLFFHDMNHKETELKVFRSEFPDEWADFQTHFPIKISLQTDMQHDGQFTFYLGKKNNVVNRITRYIFSAGGQEIVLLLTEPDTERISYEKDIILISKSVFFPTNSEIMLEKKMSELLGQNYEDIKAYFINKGFTNVNTQPMNDVVVGLFLKPGIVDKVLINGSTDYKPGDWVNKDAEIIIIHHSNK